MSFVKKYFAENKRVLNQCGNEIRITSVHSENRFAHLPLTPVDKKKETSTQVARLFSPKMADSLPALEKAKIWGGQVLKGPRFCQFYPNSATIFPKLAQILPILPPSLGFCQILPKCHFQISTAKGGQILPNGSEFCYLATLVSPCFHPSGELLLWSREMMFAQG